MTFAITAFGRPDKHHRVFADHVAAAQCRKADVAGSARAGVPVAAAHGAFIEIDAAAFRRRAAEHERGAGRRIDLLIVMHLEDFDIECGVQRLGDALGQRIAGEEEVQGIEQILARAQRRLALGRRRHLLALVVEVELLGARHRAVDVGELVGEELLVIGVAGKRDVLLHLHRGVGVAVGVDHLVEQHRVARVGDAGRTCLRDTQKSAGHRANRDQAVRIAVHGVDPAGRRGRGDLGRGEQALGYRLRPPRVPIGLDQHHPVDLVAALGEVGPVLGEREDEPLLDAVGDLQQGQLDRALVLAGDQVVGLLSLTDVGRLIAQHRR